MDISNWKRVFDSLTERDCFVIIETENEATNENEEMVVSFIDTLVRGSSIIQDGKRIGAVTYGLINDPTVKYGIFIENMLNAAV